MATIPNNRPIIWLLAATVAWTAKVAVARPDDYRVNAREACRQSVSGAYIKAYDEREKARTLVKAILGTLHDTDQALAAASADERSLKAKSGAKEFEIEHAVELDTARTKVSTFAAQKKELETELARARDDEARTIEVEKGFLKAVVGAFTMTRMGDTRDGGYPIRLDYKSPCPKFRVLCPLPAADAAVIEKIPLEGDARAACQRYTGISKLR